MYFGEKNVYKGVESPHSQYSTPFSLFFLSLKASHSSAMAEVRTAKEDAKPEQAPARSYWRCNKQDFFPDKSFENFAAYKAAVAKTCSRLTDRLLDRSTDARELVELRRQSEHEMKRCLTWWDLMWLSFGSVVGAGIFTITGQEARQSAGPAIILSYAISGTLGPPFLTFDFFF